MVRHVATWVVVMMGVGFANFMRTAAPFDPGFELRKAAYVGDEARVRQLLAEHPEYINTQSENGHTSLRAAVDGDQRVIASLLLEAKADPLIGEVESKLIPLFCALEKQKYEMADLLLTQGDAYAQVRARTDSDVALLAVTLRSTRDRRAMELLLRHCSDAIDDEQDAEGRTVLVYAARDGSLEMVDLLLAARPSMEKNNRALHAAAQEGNNGVIEKLLRAGIPVDGRLPHNNMTPLMVAATEGNVGGAKMLLDAGARTDLLGIGGELRGVKMHLSPLMLAINKQKREIVKALLHPDRDDIAQQLRHADNQGYIPLEHAAMVGLADIVEEMLAKAPGLVDHRTRKGITPLMLVARAGKGQMIALLLRAGAGIDLVDVEGQTARDHAQRKGHQHIVDKLDRWAAGER